MIEKIKKEMEICIKNISINSNFEFLKKRMISLFDILILTKENCPQLLEESIASDDIKEDVQTDCKDNAQEDIDNVEGYPLERKFKGGILNVGDTEIFVPEKEIRKNNFKHGDLIKATKVDNHSNMYVFEKVREAPHPVETSREELDYCIVSDQMVGGNYIVSHQMVDGEKKLIKVNNVPMTFLISESDRLSFKLEPGKLITIAYDKNNPQNYRVCWCYSDDKLEHITPKPSSYYKQFKSREENEEVVKNNDSFNIEKELIKDKKVLVIGGDFKVHEFTTLAQQLEFELKMISGHEKEPQIEAAIRNSDMVLITSGHLNHSRTELSRDLCKTIKKPMRLIPTSLSGLKKGIIDLIQKPEVIVDSVF